MQSLFILGRQPAIGLAELESLYGAAILRPIEDSAALLDIEPDQVDFDRLGGSIKFCKVLTTLDTTDWREVERYLLASVPGRIEYLPEGKMQLGLSVYGLRVTPQHMMATGLSVKKVIKQTGRSVRLTPNKELALNSASVIHNNLTGPTGWELVFVRSGTRTIVAQTLQVQDIDSYTARDRDRPKRDARVGMLPPKLAQIIINLAVSSIRPMAGATLLDPFCGTGVVLQEASLMGFEIYGSDLDPRMVEYTDANLQWLNDRRGKHEASDTRTYNLEVGDATNHRWTPQPSFVASEVYLGRPFTALPDSQTLNLTTSECNLIIKKFLRNIHGQLPARARLCLAVPAWQTRRDQFKHLPFLGEPAGSRLDSLAELGYNRISFEHARTEDLIYYRADQIVARELLILEKL